MGGGDALGGCTGQTAGVFTGEVAVAWLALALALALSREVSISHCSGCKNPESGR